MTSQEIEAKIQIDENGSCNIVLETITPMLMKHLFKIVSRQPLKCKTLRFCICYIHSVIECDIWRYLAATLKKTKLLKNLEIGIVRMHMTEKDVAMLRECFQHHLCCLETLVITSIVANSQTTKALAEAISIKQLNFLHLESDSSEKDGICIQQAILPYLHCSQTLTTLILEDFLFDREGTVTVQLKPILSLPLLRILVLCQINLKQTEDIRYLSDRLATQDCGLVELCIDGASFVGDNAIIMAQGLIKNKSLVKFLARNPVFDNREALTNFISSLLTPSPTTLTYIDLTEPVLLDDNIDRGFRMILVELHQHVIAKLNNNKIRLFLGEMDAYDIISEKIVPRESKYNNFKGYNIYENANSLTIKNSEQDHVIEFFDNIDKYKLDHLTGFQIINSNLPNFVIPVNLLKLKNLKSLSLIKCNIYCYIYIYIYKTFFVKFFQQGFLDITIKGNFKKFFGKKIF